MVLSIGIAEVLAGTIFILGVVGWFVRDKLKDSDKRHLSHEQEIKVMKENYLDRFEKVQNAIAQSNKEIRKDIADLRVDIAENYMRKE